MENGPHVQPSAKTKDGVAISTRKNRKPQIRTDWLVIIAPFTVPNHGLVYQITNFRLFHRGFLTCSSRGLLENDVSCFWKCSDNALAESALGLIICLPPKNPESLRSGPAVTCPKATETSSGNQKRNGHNETGSFAGVAQG